MIALIGLLFMSVVASAQLVFTAVPQSSLAALMTDDAAFKTSFILADKSTITDVSFGPIDFTLLLTSQLENYLVAGGDTLLVDYLGKSSADENNFLTNLGLGDNLLYSYYGVVDDEDDSWKIEVADGFDTTLSFWNHDLTKGFNADWSDADHFKVYGGQTPNGADVLLLSVDDRGSSQLNLQDWNDGVFLVTRYTDITDIAIPEPSAVGFLAGFLLIGVAIARRR